MLKGVKDMFFLGDIVRIVKRVDLQDGISVPGWIPEMDRYIGMTGVVVNIHNTNSDIIATNYVVAINGCTTRNYLPGVIELEIDPDRINTVSAIAQRLIDNYNGR